MTKPGFRIERVTVEGFKGFTTRQTFDFGGKNAFVFGENGLGKSSIIEAIRWCLFGLGSRQGQGEIIKNQFYIGDCQVELTLKGPDGDWTMSRSIGTSGGVSTDLRDPNGRQHPLGEVFPQLTRISPTEGTHVIYVPQQPSSRRPVADITNFRNVVYRYLGLEEVPRLCDVLIRLRGEWQKKEATLASAVDKVGDTIADQIRQVDGDLDRIIAIQPWGGPDIPTFAETNVKITVLAHEARGLGAEISADLSAGSSARDVLYDVETAVDDLLSEELSVRQRRFNDKLVELKPAEDYLQRWTDEEATIHTLSEVLETCKNELSCLLNGATADELEDERDRLERSLSAAELNLEIARPLITFIDRLDDSATVCDCPACGFTVDVVEFKSRVEGFEADSDANASELLQRRQSLHARLSRARELADEIEDTLASLAESDARLETIMGEARACCNQLFPTLESLEQHVSGLRSSCEQLRSAVESQNDTAQSWKTRIENLRSEERFQRLRRRKAQLRRLQENRYVDLADDLKYLAGLRDVANQLESLLHDQLSQRLQQDLPPLEAEMTEVYRRLTGRPMFDTMNIRHEDEPDGSIALKQMVSSERGSGSWSVDSGVLNGQALSAVRLVPYLVFSRYQEDPLLDLLMLDDPTQAFDTRKIELLLEELGRASSHATIFVATHEEDRFMPHLRKYAERALRKVLSRADLSA